MISQKRVKIKIGKLRRIDLAGEPVHSNLYRRKLNDKSR